MDTPSMRPKPSRLNPRFFATLTREVLACPTAPFAEHAVLAYVDAFAKARKSIRLVVDDFGNRILSYRKGNASPVAFVAHTDHPGFVFTGWDEKGRARARFLGGMGLKQVEAGINRRVNFFDTHGGKEIVSRARIVEAWDDKKKGTPVALRFDRKPSGLPVGSPGMWDLPAMRMSGNTIHSRALDDLTGVIAMLALLDHLNRTRVAASVHCIFTRAEEVGFIGAIGLAHLLSRGAPLVPEGTPIISLEASRRLGDVVMGGGPILRVGDRKSVFDWRISCWIESVAMARKKKVKGFDYQRRLMPGGTCEATAFQALGWPSGAMCVALGNYHNMTDRGGIDAEFIDRRDLLAMAEWMADLATREGSPEKEAHALRRQMEERLNGWCPVLSGTRRPPR